MSAVGRGIVLKQMDRLFGEGTLTGLGDGQLLERYLTRRDEDAFAALVDLHGPMVLGLCRRMLRDPRDIEDAFQATFLVLVRKAPTIRDRDLLSSWLYGVAYRVARRARAQTLRRRDREATVGSLELAAEPEAADRAEVVPMLDQELRHLPERYRAPLVLCYLRGRTHEQAAEDLRCPVGTVRSRLARGRELLRKRLTRRGFAPSAFLALLGGDATLPVRLLVAPVPSTMAAAAVRAALAFGSRSILQAGAAAASSVVLARGVLTTMKIAQFQWIGLAAMAVGLSAVGGVAVVGGASAPHPGAARVEAPAPLSSPEEPQNQAANPRPALIDKERQDLLDKVEALTKDNDLKATEIANLNDRIRQSREDRNKGQNRDQPGEPGDARMKLLEDKVDRLVSWANTPTAHEPVAVLSPQLDHAIKQFRRIPSDDARERVREIAARVEILDQETRDELGRLELDRRRRAAMLDKAAAEEEMARLALAYTKTLADKMAISHNEVATVEGKHKVAVAGRKVAEVGVEEVNLEIARLQRKRQGVEELVKRAGQAKALIR